MKFKIKILIYFILLIWIYLLPNNLKAEINYVPGFIAANKANLFDSPSTNNSNIITSLKNMTKVFIISNTENIDMIGNIYNKWYYIKLSNKDTKGWVWGYNLWNNKANKSNVVSVGINLTNNLRIYNDIDNKNSGYDILAKFEPFFVIESKTNNKKTWLKIIKPLSNERTGWISKEYIFDESNCQYLYKDFRNNEKNKFTHLYACAALQYFRSKDYIISEALFKYIFKNLKNQKIPDEGIVNYYFIDIEALSLFYLSEIAIITKKYNDSINYLKLLIEKYPNRELWHKAEIIAYEKLVTAYLHKKEYRSAININHDIIKKFENEGKSGFEWNSYIDIDATQSMIKIIRNNISNSSQLLADEMQKVIKNNSNPAVILICYGEQVKIYAVRNEWDKLKNICKEVILEYKNVSRRYFKSDFNYSAGFVNSTLNFIMNELNNYDKALEFVLYMKSLLKPNENNSTLNNMNALILDRGVGSKSEVINAYKKINNTKRLEQIEEFISMHGIVIKDCKFYLGLNANKVYKLKKDQKVEFLYESSELFNIDGLEDYMVKVKTDDNIIGWIFKRNTRPSKEINIFPEVLSKEQFWSTSCADNQKTSYLSANPIKNPKIHSIKNATSREPVFFDVNNDNFIDIITKVNRRFACINGKNQSILWTCNESISTPTIKNNILYASTYDAKVIAIDIKNGKILWKDDYNIKNHYQGGMGKVLIHSNELIVPNETRGIITYNKVTGDKIFSFYEKNKDNRPSGIYPNSLVIGNNILFFTAYKKHQNREIYVYALDLEKKEILWEYKVIKDFKWLSVSGLALDLKNQNVIFADSNGRKNGFGNLNAISMKNAELKWRTEISVNISYQHRMHFKPSIANDIVVYPTSNGLYGIKLKNGKILWNYYFKYYLGRSIVAIGGNTVYVPSEFNTLHAVNIKNGNKIWEIRLGDRQLGAGAFYNPTINQDCIVIGSPDGNLYIVKDKIIR